jgi:hypothetical protein
MTPRETPCNAVQPASKRTSPRIDTASLAHDYQKCLLGDILRIIAISYYLFHKQRHWANVAPDEHAERLLVTGDHPGKDCVIRRITGVRPIHRIVRAKRVHQRVGGISERPKGIGWLPPNYPPNWYTGRENA